MEEFKAGGDSKAVRQNGSADEKSTEEDESDVTTLPSEILVFTGFSEVFFYVGTFLPVSIGIYSDIKNNPPRLGKEYCTYMSFMLY